MLRDLHMWASACFPAHHHFHRFPNSLLLVTPLAAMAEVVLLCLGRCPCTIPAYINLSILSKRASISFQNLYLPPLAARLRKDALLHLICTPRFLSALLGLGLLPMISFCAPLSPSALPYPKSHSTAGTPAFLVTCLLFPRIHHIAFQTPFWFTAC